jgi:rhodanese-related sulfurtransferase
MPAGWTRWPRPVDAWSAEDVVSRSLSPEQVLADVQAGRVRLLDLRTWPERRLLGSPPGAQPVSLVRHLLRPAGPGTVYLCAHAVRSKWTLRKGAAEVAGGHRAWRKRGLPLR